MFQIELIIFCQKLPIKTFLILPVVRKSHRLENIWVVSDLSFDPPTSFSVNKSNQFFLCDVSYNHTYLSFRYHCHHSSLDLRAYTTVMPPKSFSLLPVLSLSHPLSWPPDSSFSNTAFQVTPDSESFHHIQTN